MLILRRNIGQTIKIGNETLITVLSYNEPGVVEIGIEAPSDIVILRGELCKVAQSTKLQRQKIIRRRNKQCPVCGGNYSDYQQREINPCCKAVYLADRADHQSIIDEGPNG